MVHVSGFLEKIVIVSIIILITFSCCDEGDKHYYFPEEAINLYNLNNVVLFNDTVNDEFEEFVVCDRDTLLTEFLWGGWCGYKDHNHVISYKLVKDECSSSRLFYVDVHPDTLVEIILSYPSGTRSFFNSKYNENPKYDVTFLGITYRDVVQIESTQNDGLIVLFNLEYGIIQYTVDDLTYNLFPND